jgi:hypothetical protein
VVVYLAMLAMPTFYRFEAFVDRDLTRKELLTNTRALVMDIRVP